MRSCIFCIFGFLCFLTTQGNSQLFFVGSYYNDGNSAAMLFCGPNVLTGNWLVDAKKLGSFSIAAEVSFLLPSSSSPSCSLIGQNLSSAYTINCTGPSIQFDQYNSDSCSGEIAQTATTNNGDTCPSIFTNDDGHTDDAVNPSQQKRTSLACMKDYLKPTKNTIFAILLTGNGPDIQLISLPECTTTPISSSMFSGYENMFTAVFNYSNGCYILDQHMPSTTSISGFMDCKTGEMDFRRYETSDCTGPAYNISGICSVSVIDNQTQIINGFCLGQSSSSNTISLGILIGVPVGVGIVLVTGLICYLRKRCYED